MIVLDPAGFHSGSDEAVNTASVVTREDFAGVLRTYTAIELNSNFIMTSTEFTVGLGEGARISSKVLKPPGGGSSDIFGLGGGALSGSNKSSTEKSTNDSSTHSRVFGVTDLPPPPAKSLPLHQSSIFENGNEAPPPSTPPKQKSTKKVYVRRNPITGEEIEISLETENDKNVCDNEEVKEEESASAPSKPVPTSIRVRNPPGGKSSGIF